MRRHRRGGRLRPAARAPPGGGRAARDRRLPRPAGRVRRQHRGRTGTPRRARRRLRLRRRRSVRRVRPARSRDERDRHEWPALRVRPRHVEDGDHSGGRRGQALHPHVRRERADDRGGHHAAPSSSRQRPCTSAAISSCRRSARTSSPSGSDSPELARRGSFSTSPSRGRPELSLDSVRALLPLADYFVPNDDEARALTGESDPHRQAEALPRVWRRCGRDQDGRARRVRSHRRHGARGARAAGRRRRAVRRGRRVRRRAPCRHPRGLGPRALDSLRERRRRVRLHRARLLGGRLHAGRGRAVPRRASACGPGERQAEPHVPLVPLPSLLADARRAATPSATSRPGTATRSRPSSRRRRQSSRPSSSASAACSWIRAGSTRAGSRRTPASDATWPSGRACPSRCSSTRRARSTHALRGVDAGFNAVMMHVADERARASDSEGARARGGRARERRRRRGGAGHPARRRGTERSTRARRASPIPRRRAAFVADTGVDCLAVSFGNVHLLEGRTAPVDLDLLDEVGRSVDVPLVVHGGTSFPAEAVGRRSPGRGEVQRRDGAEARVPGGRDGACHRAAADGGRARRAWLARAERSPRARARRA